MKKILITLSLLVAIFGLASPASAADPSCTFSTPAVASPECEVEVKPVTLEPTDTQTIAAPDVAPVPRVQTQLPVTGVESATLAALGMAMVGGGALLVSRSRRHNAIEA